MKLTAPKDKIIVEVDLESKNSHTFQDGTKINVLTKFSSETV